MFILVQIVKTNISLTQKWHQFYVYVDVKNYSFKIFMVNLLVLSKWFRKDWLIFNMKIFFFWK